MCAHGYLCACACSPQPQARAGRGCLLQRMGLRVAVGLSPMAGRPGSVVRSCAPMCWVLARVPHPCLAPLTPGYVEHACSLLSQHWACQSRGGAGVQGTGSRWWLTRAMAHEGVGVGRWGKGRPSHQACGTPSAAVFGSPQTTTPASCAGASPRQPRGAS